MPDMTSYKERSTCSDSVEANKQVSTSGTVVKMVGMVGDAILTVNLKRRKAFYGDWWDEAAQWRTGGFDRVCAGIAESPTTRQIRDRGIKGTLFVNEVLTVQPGTQVEYLNLVASERCGVMNDHGIHATGLWEVVNNAHEVVMVWATTVDDWVQFHFQTPRKDLMTVARLMNNNKWAKTLPPTVGGDTILNLLTEPCTVPTTGKKQTSMIGSQEAPDAWDTKPNRRKQRLSNK